MHLSPATLVWSLCLVLITLCLSCAALFQTRLRLDASREQRWKAALEGSGCSVWWLNPKDWSIRYTTDAPRALGYEGLGSHLTWAQWLSFVKHEDIARVERALARHIDGRDGYYQCEYQVLNARGDYEWIRAKGSLARFGNTVLVCGTFVQITQEKQFHLEREQLISSAQEEKERLKTTLFSIEDAVITVDGNGRIMFMNPAAERLIGCAFDKVAGSDVVDVLKIAPSDSVHPFIRCAERGHMQVVDSPIAFKNQFGEQLSVRGKVSPIRSFEGEFAGAVITLQDVTHSTVLQQQLNHSHDHDALTGTLNRAGFKRRLQRALEERLEADEGREAGVDQVRALIVLDIDRFKLVNDLAGHIAGDRLLCEVAVKLKTLAGDQAVLARLGGDEFGVMRPFKDTHQARQFAESLLESLHEHVFSWQGRLYDASSSMGMVMFKEGSHTVSELLSKADIASHSSKRNGGNRLSVFEPGELAVERHAEEMSVAAEMREALAKERFVLYEQPIRCLDGLHRDHIEVLLRMRDCHGTLIAPGLFIPVAEQFGLMPSVDRWVIRTVLIERGASLSDRDVGVSINLSGASLNDPSFPEFLATVLDQTQLPPSSIVFELTETALVNHIDRARALILRLRARGCRIALDDFGSGVSSFSYIQQFEVDIIKIDGAFVKHLLDSPLDRVIVESIQRVADQIKAMTVAEYVESAELYRALSHIGINYAQGYFIQAPVPMALPGEMASQITT
ncbi:EAL domain-containing protein [Larsenimonas salina]|uniref:EAL domain-containing protein n=1 Tax=Larsenimonas salina TaxID=1295565 RepID=UPI002074A338|nr:EAL domain-containing protein [Larsenimonas salina]MCM5705529.1 EAL domain-containing protein [Larsenimonas salina]